jgi:hypothetical protein
MARLLAAFLLPAPLLFATAVFAQCPPNYVGWYLTTPSGTPIVASAHRDSSCLGGNFCQWKSQWNDALGTAHVDAGNVSCPTESGNSSDVGQYTSDDFVLTGPSGGGSLTFQAILHVSGSSPLVCRTICIPECFQSCASGSLSASLGDGTQTSSTGTLQSTTTNLVLSTDLVLTLSKMVGEHFHLDRSLHAMAFCSGSATLSSQLEIVPPAGYGVTSCYGYTASGPVATLPTSWGHLKAMYR